MFTGFDFGKSLLKQVEAFKRLPPSQQPRREAALTHALDAYTKKFMVVLSNPGTTANPGLLKNGAEALLEAALAVKEAHISYTAFADMVERSRKVPVVPGLAGLIDRLLELPTDLKTERIRMLNWRISTGSLRPERSMAYLSERAKLTGDTADWKDYTYALAQLVNKGTLKLTDELALTSLEDLAANKGMLGDRAPGMLLMHIQAQIERKNYRPAEAALIAMMAEYKKLPDNYVHVAMMLLDARPEASWELHLAALNYLIPAYIAEKVTWSQLMQRIERAHGYMQNIVDTLLNSPQMPADERLCTLVADRIMVLDASLQQEYLERWRIVLQKAGVAPPESALEAIEQRKAGLASELLQMELDPEALARYEAQLEEQRRRAEEAAAEAEAEALAEAEAAAEEARRAAELAAAAEQEALPADGAEEEPAELEPEAFAGEYDEADALAQLESGTGGDEELEAAPEELLEEPAVHLEVEEEEAEPAAEIEEDLAGGVEETPAEVVAGPEDAMEMAAPEEEVVEEQPAVWPEAQEEAAQPQAVPPGGAKGLLDFTGCSERIELHERLDKWVTGIELDEECIGKLVAELDAEDQPRWITAEGKLWLAEWLAAEGAQNTALTLLAGIETDDPVVAREYRIRIGKLAGAEELPPAAVAALGRLSLVAEDYAGALAAALALDEASEERAALLARLQELLLQLSEPGPQLLMVLAQATRAALHDPQAGCEAATTASLLALDDPAVQQLYTGWCAAVPAPVLQRQRAQQAVFLCSHQQRLELLDVALESIEALAALPQSAQDPQLLEWLEQLRFELDKLAPELQAPSRLRWTRLYLSRMAHTGQRDRIPALLASAAEQIEPEAALILVHELAGEIPQEMRRTIECESYLRQGAWEQALDVALDEEAAGTAVVPWERLCQQLPQHALLSAGQRISQVLVARGDDAGRLDVVRYLGERAGGNGDDHPDLDEDELELRGFLEQVLSDLCAHKYEPAVRYRLELSGSEDPLQAAHDLLALAREGDTAALGQLEAMLDRLVDKHAPAELLFDIADELVRANPASVLPVLTKVGLATGEATRALYRIDELNTAAQTAEEAQQLGRLATLGQDHPRMLVLAKQLAEQGREEAALELVQAVLAAEPDSDLAQIEMIRLQLQGETRNFALATSNLLRLSQFYQEHGIRPRQALEPLRNAIDSACAIAPGEQDAQHLKLTMLALSGELERAAQLVQQIMLRGPQAADGLLALFERLALEDAELPSPMLIAWGRALFRAGRIDDALSRLAGLRDAVGDFPEYAELLEEIKAAGGGPGAGMQLGETYLRVHLWQRSAEEYAAVLEQDPALAEPVLTQLRHHNALDPNPMKYPLHLLGLRAVANSSRQADWGWALSALTWLITRWSPEELYSLAQALWEQHHLGDLDEHQRSELLLHLFRLAQKLGRNEEALRYLSYAWEAFEQPGPELLAALGMLDEEAFANNQQALLTLHRYRTQAAMLQGPAPAAVLAARKLAAISEEGRVLALLKLEEYQRTLDDPLPAMLARLRLLNLTDSTEREAFVHELLAVAGGGLPREQVHSLINTVLELFQENVDSPELAQLLMLLFRQLGDQSRAWQLAQSFIIGEAAPTPTALDTMRAVAADEFAVQQRIMLVEVYLVRGEHALAAAALEQLSWSDLGEHGASAEDLAEALLSTPAQAAARRWLIGRLRDADNPVLAADHLLWAHTQGTVLPAEWLNEQRNGALLYRAGMLQELQDNAAAARRTYAKARDTAALDSFTAASIRWRLVELAEAAGELEEADALCKEVLQLIPGYKAAQERSVSLERAIAQREIVAMRTGADDDPVRTVQIVTLLRQIGDVNEAINELQSALGRGQNVPEVYIELAECFTDSGDYPIARRAYHEVLKMMQQGGPVELKLRALYGLATAEEQLGDLNEAARCLEELLLIRRDYLDGKQRLQRVQTRLKPGAQPKPKPQTGKLVDEILSLLGMPEDEDTPGRGKQ